MESGELIVNRVEASGLITLNLEEFYPKESILVFDLKDYLFRGLIIKEKEFREALKNTNWQQYQNANVAITCSTDAIIPMWAYMLATTYLQPVANSIVLGNKEKATETFILKNIESINTAEYTDKRLVVKGCGDIPIPESAYIKIVTILQPHVKSIMYGEPCSTVPVYKKR